jgi:hypothetical protein
VHVIDLHTEGSGRLSTLSVSRQNKAETLSWRQSGVSSLNLTDRLYAIFKLTDHQSHRCHAAAVGSESTHPFAIAQVVTAIAQLINAAAISD